MYIGIMNYDVSVFKHGINLNRAEIIKMIDTPGDEVIFFVLLSAIKPFFVC